MGTAQTERIECERAHERVFELYRRPPHLDSARFGSVRLGIVHKPRKVVDSYDRTVKRPTSVCVFVCVCVCVLKSSKRVNQQTS